MLDFPSTPNIGDKYPQPALQGVAQYTWDGEKWGAGVTAPPPTWAAPMDALAYNGMQVNGSCEVSQQLLGAGTQTTSIYALDNWIHLNQGTGVTKAQQMPYPTFPLPSMMAGLSVITAQATMTGTQFVGFMQPVEGYRMVRLGWGAANAQPLTIAFWTAHPLPGTYSIAIVNGLVDRSCVAAYVQNAANTPQYNVITIPGDIGGTWYGDNQVGLSVYFALACGPNRVAPNAGVWNAAPYFAAPGQVNGAASTANALRITGLIILPGLDAPSAARAPLIMRPFPDELRLCQRYWETSYDYGVVAGATNSFGSAVNIAARAWSATATAGYGVGFRFATPKRIAPTVSTYDPLNGIGGNLLLAAGGAGFNAGATISGVGRYGVSAVYTTTASGLVVGQAIEQSFHFLANARL